MRAQDKLLGNYIQSYTTQLQCKDIKNSETVKISLFLQNELENFLAKGFSVVFSYIIVSILSFEHESHEDKTSKQINSAIINTIIRARIIFVGDIYCMPLLPNLKRKAKRLLVNIL